ncbi:DUF4304 domain-containing protein [Chryseobacterium sp.]|uniref:DUF4304 domain-containing protein n=1 Tax=Chryseobacterium sp. TaxID=1871047 RepID=UPI002FCBE7C2
MGIFSKLFGSKQTQKTDIDDKSNLESSLMQTTDLKNDFDIICKEIIIPFFKEFGFKRKTLHFARQVNDITQCFNVQKSKWNSYNDSVTFTFNFGFYNADITSIVAENFTQNDFPKTYECFIQNRLGIFSHNRDHWYTLSKNIDLKNTATEIKNDLDKYLKPIFDNYNSLETLKILIEKDEKYISPTLSPYYLIAFYMLTNEKEKGQKTIIEHYQNAIKPQTVTDTIVFPDGTRQEKVRRSINQHYIDSIKKLAEKYDVEL